MTDIIHVDRSVIPACDVPFEPYVNILRATGRIEKVGAYKTGVSFLDVGLKKVVDAAMFLTDVPIIYDHQKAGTDIHESTPDAFMDSMVRAGIAAVILFPQAGPVTEYEWISAAQKRELGVIVGGEMTHPRYLDGDLSNSKKKDYTQIFRDLGINRDIPGFIRQFAPEDMYEIAARMGVTNFVVPGNKPDKITHYRQIIEDVCGVKRPSYFSPGLVTQGGDITDGAKAAGDRFHAIVGRGIFNPKDKKNLEDVTNDEMHEAALQATSKL